MLRRLTPYLFVLTVCAMSSATHARKWTDPTRQAFCGSRAGEIIGEDVVLQKPDMRAVRVPIATLSHVDQAYVQGVIDATKVNAKQDENGDDKLKQCEVNYATLLAAHREAVERLKTQQTELEDANEQIKLLQAEPETGTGEHASAITDTIEACRAAVTLASTVAAYESRLEDMAEQYVAVSEQLATKTKAGQPTDDEERILANLRAMSERQKEQYENLKTQVPTDPALLDLYNRERKKELSRRASTSNLTKTISKLSWENKLYEQKYGPLPERPPNANGQDKDSPPKKIEWEKLFGAKQ